MASTAVPRPDAAPKSDAEQQCDAEVPKRIDAALPS
jgi:hypothetical protein